MDDNPRDIHVALAGYGYAGRTYHAPLIERVEGLHLHQIISSDAAKVASDWPGVPVVSFDAALADPSVDLVVVVTPHAAHAQMARRALEARKHLVVEKPMAVTDDDAASLCALAAKAGTVATVFHNRRWDTDFLTLRTLLSEQRLGSVTEFESRFDRYRPVVRDRWRERPGPGAGTWFDLGPHLVDQALLLFGEPRSLYAELASEREGSQATDFFRVQLQYEGMRAVLGGSSVAAEPGPRFRVVGTAGTHTTFGEISGAGGNYAVFYEAVRDAIRGAIPTPPVTFSEAARVVYALNLAERSARERRELPWAPV